MIKKKVPVRSRRPKLKRKPPRKASRPAPKRAQRKSTHPKPKRAPRTRLMPVLFIGHGSPINAIEDNDFSRGWKLMAEKLPRPKAILCISAHWETIGTQVMGVEHPKTIHDFEGFPEPLYEAQYPAPGDPALAERVTRLLRRIPAQTDLTWGLDHGCWAVLKQMYPEADIPVVQLSLDYTKPPKHHYTLAQALAPLRQQGVLILGSGNMVHNLYRASFRGSDFNTPFGYDWAVTAGELFKQLILANDHAKLIDYPSLGEAARLAVPTNEHFLPLLYVLALKREQDPLVLFNDQLIAGSLAMTSVKIG